jgi:hypothetical protein
MDPPKINYLNPNTLLVIGSRGKMRQLFTPFPVQVVKPTAHFKENTRLVVEEIQQHPKHLLLYRVINHWWPYHIFRIDVRF